MKKVLLFVVWASLAAWGQTAFTGTWRIDVNQVQFPAKADEVVMHNGMYSCATCVPPIKVKADGTDQKVTGSPYFDTIRVHLVNDKTMETTYKKDGKVVSTMKETLSPDGEHIDVTWTEHPQGSPQPVSGKSVLSRVSKGPAGAHPFSGSWRAAKVEQVSQNALMVTFKASGEGLSMSTPTGESYDARFDGKDYPYKGNPGITTVALKKVDANTIVETDKRDGKIISESRMTVEPGGKMKVTYEDKLRGTSTGFVAQKQ